MMQRIKPLLSRSSHAISKFNMIGIIHDRCIRRCDLPFFFSLLCCRILCLWLLFLFVQIQIHRKTRRCSSNSYTFIYISFKHIYIIITPFPLLPLFVFCALQWKILAATSAILLEILSVWGPSKNLGNEDIAWEVISKKKDCREAHVQTQLPLKGPGLLIIELVGTKAVATQTSSTTNWIFQVLLSDSSLEKRHWLPFE